MNLVKEKQGGLVPPPPGPQEMAIQAHQALHRHYPCFAISCRSSGLLSSALSQSDCSGLQMGAAYSSKVLYATSLVLLGAKAKFLRRKPSALEEISETC